MGSALVAIFQYWRLSAHGRVFKLFVSAGHTLIDAKFIFRFYDKFDVISGEEFLQ